MPWWIGERIETDHNSLVCPDHLAHVVEHLGMLGRVGPDRTASPATSVAL